MHDFFLNQITEILSGLSGVLFHHVFQLGIGRGEEACFLKPLLCLIEFLVLKVQECQIGEQGKVFRIHFHCDVQIALAQVPVTVLKRTDR